MTKRLWSVSEWIQRSEGIVEIKSSETEKIIACKHVRKYVEWTSEKGGRDKAG